VPAQPSKFAYDASSQTLTLTWTGVDTDKAYRMVSAVLYGDPDARPEPTRSEEPKGDEERSEERPHYNVGDVYEGRTIAKVGLLPDGTAGVFVLDDGSRAKFHLGTGVVIAFKEAAKPRSAEQPSPPAASPVEQGSKKAESSDFTERLASAQSLADAVAVLVQSVGRENAVRYAVENRDRVPAFARVQQDRLAARVERILEAGSL
jgi:hypothetical protein